MPNLSDDDMVTVMEIARIALGDADIFDEVADQLDLSDEAMGNLRDRLQKELDSHVYAYNDDGSVSYVDKEK